MKTLFTILWLLIAGSAFAATVNLAWDAMPAGQNWTQVRAYERVGAVAPFTYTLVGTSGCPGCIGVSIPNVPVGTHTYIVRSWDSQQESADSNSAQGTILSVPNPPSTITITITPGP
jgi:hypothetical protein